MFRCLCFSSVVFLLASTTVSLGIRPSDMLARLASRQSFRLQSNTSTGGHPRHTCSSHTGQPARSMTFAVVMSISWRLVVHSRPPPFNCASDRGADRTFTPHDLACPP